MPSDDIFESLRQKWAGDPGILADVLRLTGQNLSYPSGNDFWSFDDQMGPVKKSGDELSLEKNMTDGNFGLWPSLLKPRCVIWAMKRLRPLLAEDDVEKLADVPVIMTAQPTFDAAVQKSDGALSIKLSLPLIFGISCSNYLHSEILEFHEKKSRCSSSGFREDVLCNVSMNCSHSTSRSQHGLSIPGHQ